MNDTERFKILERHGWVKLWAGYNEILTLEDILCSHENNEECNAETQETVERDGIQFIAGYYTLNPEAGDCWQCDNEGPNHHSEDWHLTDSIGGFAGYTWKGSGYDDDVKAETARQFIAAWRKQCIPWAAWIA